MMEEQDRVVLYQIRDALVGTLEKPGLITKVANQHEDVYGEPNGLISRMGRHQSKLERIENQLEEGKNRFKGGWSVLGFIAMGLAWVYTTFIKK